MGYMALPGNLCLSKRFESALLHRLDLHGLWEPEGVAAHIVQGCLRGLRRHAASEFNNDAIVLQVVRGMASRPAPFQLRRT